MFDMTMSALKKRSYQISLKEIDTQLMTPSQQFELIMLVVEQRSHGIRDIIHRINIKAMSDDQRSKLVEALDHFDIVAMYMDQFNFPTDKQFELAKRIIDYDRKANHFYNNLDKFDVKSMTVEQRFELMSDMAKVNPPLMLEAMDQFDVKLMTVEKRLKLMSDMAKVNLPIMLESMDRFDVKLMTVEQRFKLVSDIAKAKPPLMPEAMNQLDLSNDQKHDLLTQYIGSIESQFNEHDLRSLGLDITAMSDNQRSNLVNVLIEKHPITLMGCLNEFHMSEEQTSQLFNKLRASQEGRMILVDNLDQFRLSPEDRAEFIDSLIDNDFGAVRKKGYQSGFVGSANVL